MAKRVWVFGFGCLVVLVVAVLAAVMVIGIAQSRVPGKVVVSLRLGGPIAEVTAEDPLAELLGEQPISLRDLHDAMHLAAKDDRVEGVRVRLDGFGGGMATAYEVRSLLSTVKAGGKWTAAYMDTAGEGGPGNLPYYVAAACKEVSLNPLGDLNLIGLSSRSPFIRGTLDKLGINPEFPGRGDYKTARFMYTHKEFTPAQLEMMEWLLGSLDEQLTSDIGADRGLSADQVKALIDRAPFLGQEAVDAKLVDTLEDWGSFTARLEERAGKDATVLDFADYLRRARRSPSGDKIAVVTAVGAILRGESRKSVNPLLGEEVMGSETIAKAWRDVRKAKGIKAAIFRIDSPGGSAIASEVIRQEMERTAETIPVVVSMAGFAASGGYWITCGSKRIVACPCTLTASIGVFSGHLNMDQFWGEKLGVTFGRLDRGTNANIYGDLEDWTDEQRAIVNRQLDRIYGAFVDRVSSSRNMSPEAVRAIGDGRVFTGVQAAAKHLVDVVGGFDEALAQARQVAGITPEAPLQLIDFPKPLPWWQKLARRGREEETAVREASAAIRQWWQTGVAEVPGEVWMSPVYVR